MLKGQERERGQLNVTWNRYQQSRETEEGREASRKITNVSKSIQNSAFLAVENVQKKKKIKEGKRTKLLQENRKEKQLLVVRRRRRQ